MWVCRICDAGIAERTGWEMATAVEEVSSLPRSLLRLTGELWAVPPQNGHRAKALHQLPSGKLVAHAKRLARAATGNVDPANPKPFLGRIELPQPPAGLLQDRYARVRSAIGAAPCGNCRPLLRTVSLTLRPPDVWGGPLGAATCRNGLQELAEE